MPQIDFTRVDDVQDFTPVPAGRYLVRVDEITERETQHGDDMWGLRHVILEGPHTDRYLFDNLVFSPAALPRLKLVCKAVGLNVSGQLDLTPQLVRGRTCLVTADIDEYEDEEGHTKTRNVIPFAGYAPAEAAQSAGDPDLSEETLAF
jgi:hypothetical protein